MNASTQTTGSTSTNPTRTKSTKARTAAKEENILWRNGWAYFRKVIELPDGSRKRMTVALGTQDKELARAKARQKRNELKHDELKAMTSRRVTAPATMGKVLEAYKLKIHTVNEGLDPESVMKNISAFRSFWRWAHGANGVKDETLDVDALSAGLFADEVWVARFKANYVATAGGDYEARESRKRGAASIMRQLKSMFSAPAMLLYREFNLPDLTRFRTAATLEAEDRVHRPIASATLAELHAAIEAVKTEQPQLWLAHQLQKFLGLRNDEICQARVEWFKRAPWGQVFFSVLRTPYFEPKQSEGHVPLTAEVAALFAPFVAGKQPQDFLIEAKHPTEREELVNRTHAAFMRRFLPAEEYAKAGYELRRWASQVMEERYGHDAAKAFLRHTPQGVAERHYFERWFPWRRLGPNVGITIADAQGHREDSAVDAWVEGTDALLPMESGMRKAETTPDARSGEPLPFKD